MANSFRLAALLLLLGFGLTGCGVNGAPQPPIPDEYPHQYPPPDAPVAGAPAVAPAPASPAFPPNTGSITNTNQPMYQ